MSIIDDRVKSGLLADNKIIDKTVSKALSELNANVSLIAEMYPYLSDQIDKTSEHIPTAYLLELRSKFTDYLSILRSIESTMAHVEKLMSGDATLKAEGKAALDTINNDKPAFENRYN